MKRTMLLWGCAAILLFTACDRRPSDVMDKRQMAEVLTDVHIAESAVAQSEWKSSKAHKQLYGNSVFEKHGITKEDFDRSVEWYALHPEKYVAVYDIVEENLDSLEKDIENYVYHPDEKPTAADSIDTIDIWDKRPSLIYPVKRSADFRAEDLEFYCTNLHLACGDHYRLYLLMRAYALDTAARRMFIAVEKNDSVTDTLSCRIMTDSVLRRYSLTVRLPDTVCARSIRAVLMDSVRGIESMEIDSVHLYRVYNFYEYSLSYRYKRKLKERQDSAAQLSAKIEKRLRAS